MKKSTCFILLITLLISSCFNEKKPENINISFMHYFSGSLNGGINEMVKTFNKNQSKYILSATPLDHEMFKSNIRETLKNGNPPDIYSYWAGSRVGSVISDLAPIDYIWKKKELKNKFSSMIINSACTYKGNKYFIPITQHFVSFIYNKKVFKNLNITTPKNWDDFIAVCETLKKNDITPIALGNKPKWPAQFWFDYISARAYGNDFRKKILKGEIKYSDPKVKEVFKLWIDLLISGYFNKDANQIDWDNEAIDLFAHQKAGMMLMGTWIIGVLNNSGHNMQSDIDYDFFPFPEINPSVEGCSIGPIDGLVIPQKALNKKGAMEALVYFADDNAQIAFSKGSGAFIPNTTASTAHYSPLQKRMLRVIKESKHWSFAYDLLVSPECAEIGLDAFKQILDNPHELEDILRETDRKINLVK